MLVGVFFDMMLIKEESQTRKKLEYYILYYTFHNMNIPFDCKTITFAIKSLKYGKGYIAMTLSNLVHRRYLTEPEVGIYVMTEDSFEIIQTTNPDFAKEIKSRLKYDKTVKCQNSSS